jgi:hypothetical protein
VPSAALAWPFWALAPPTPKLEPVPALPDEEPAVPNAVLALPLPEVEAPEPTVEELWARAAGTAAITATIAAAENSVLLRNILFHSMSSSPLTRNGNVTFNAAFRDRRQSIGVPLRGCVLICGARRSSYLWFSVARFVGAAKADEKYRAYCADAQMDEIAESRRLVICSWRQPGNWSGYKKGAQTFPWSVSAVDALPSEGLAEAGLFCFPSDELESVFQPWEQGGYICAINYVQ